MANWCSNSITFDNFKSSEKRKELLQWIEEAEQDLSSDGKIPKFLEDIINDINCEGGEYLFDLTTMGEEEDTAIYIQCETKWAPPLGVMCLMAKHYECDAHIEYEEFGCLIYGESKYDLDSDTLLDRSVNPAEWPDDDCENDDYYESIYEKLDKIVTESPFTPIPYYYERSNS